jgi:Mg-chelatase subunit ChlD
MKPPETDQSGPDLEVKITALLLGELDPVETAELRLALDRDPELGRLHQRLAQTIARLREASSAAQAPDTGFEGGSVLASRLRSPAFSAAREYARPTERGMSPGPAREYARPTERGMNPGPAREYAPPTQPGVMVPEPPGKLKDDPQERTSQEQAASPTEPLPRLSAERRQRLLDQFKMLRVDPRRSAAPPGQGWAWPMALAALLVGLLGLSGLWLTPNLVKTKSRSMELAQQAVELDSFRDKATNDFVASGLSRRGGSPSARLERQPSEALRAPSSERFNERELVSRADALVGLREVRQAGRAGAATAGAEIAGAIGGGGGFGGGGPMNDRVGVSAKDSRLVVGLELAPADESKVKAKASPSASAPGGGGPLPGMMEPALAARYGLAAGKPQPPGSHPAPTPVAPTRPSAGAASPQVLAESAATPVAPPDDGLVRLWSVPAPPPILGDTPQLGRRFKSANEARDPGTDLAHSGLKVEHTDDLKAAEPVISLGYFATQDDSSVRDTREVNESRERSGRLAQEGIERVARGTVPQPLPEPQPEVLTRDHAFSTFSLNVSDVSFKLAEASLQRGVMPDPAGIRSESFVNAFDYRDPLPASGQAVGFAWEQARYPFAHNREIVRFAVKTAASGREAGRPLNVVLCLDSSGSMERADRVGIVREALRVLGEQLKPGDRLSMVTFARTARLWIDGVDGAEASGFLAQMESLQPEGGTNLEEALRLAYDTARRHASPQGINRVVLMTDGAANLGDVNAASLKVVVEQQRKQGVALDCFGIGWEGLNDELLESLSRNGDGRYGFLNDRQDVASNFAQQLTGALQVAAADVKVQVEFNPQRVISYRQIGYARHQLTQEQFRDNTVDAAELGAAEAGNALYVIQTDAQGTGPLGVVRVRFQRPGSGLYEAQEWLVPYHGPAMATEQAPASLRLAMVAAAFSEWLASSPFATEVRPAELLRWLRQAPEEFGIDSRPTRLEWMIRQALALTGNKS